MISSENMDLDLEISSFGKSRKELQKLQSVSFIFNDWENSNLIFLSIKP